MTGPCRTQKSGSTRIVRNNSGITEFRAGLGKPTQDKETTVEHVATCLELNCVPLKRYVAVLTPST